MDKPTFSDIFNELLLENGLNRKQFAEKSGIPYTTVIGWTNLGRLPDYSALIKIADYFQCSVDFIVGRQDETVHNPVIVTYNSTEQALLKNFRKLRPENKELILKLITNLTEEKP